MYAQRLSDDDMAFLKRIGKSLPHCALRDMIEQAISLECARLRKAGTAALDCDRSERPFNSPESIPKRPGVYEISEPIGHGTSFESKSMAHWNGYDWWFVSGKGRYLVENQCVYWR